MSDDVPSETPEAMLKRIVWENSVMESVLREIAEHRVLGFRTRAGEKAAAVLDGIDGVRADTVG